MSNSLMFDLSLLLSNDGKHGYAVRCETFEEAKQFVDFVKEYYPDEASNWDEGEYRFDDYGEDTAYTFHFRYDLWKIERLMYGDWHDCEYDGYIILDFEEILRIPDLEESDIAIDFLFAGV